MDALVALEYGDLCRAESVMARAEQGVPVEPRMVFQANVMREQAGARIRDLTTLDPTWRCPMYPPNSQGGF